MFWVKNLLLLIVGMTQSSPVQSMTLCSNQSTQKSGSKVAPSPNMRSSQSSHHSVSELSQPPISSYLHPSSVLTTPPSGRTAPAAKKSRLSIDSQSATYSAESQQILQATPIVRKPIWDNPAGKQAYDRKLVSWYFNNEFLLFVNQSSHPCEQFSNFLFRREHGNMWFTSPMRPW